MAIVLCIAEADQIARVDKVFAYGAPTPIEDWRRTPLKALVVRAIAAGGLIGEWLSDEYGRPSAVVLSAADPRSITRLEEVFVMPK